MKLYRFSPITTQDELIKAIEHIHFSCYELCKQSFGKYLPNAGNVGVFCHYDDEFNQLIKFRDELTEHSDNPDLKYYTLLKPIVIEARGDVPEATYRYLYTRKPDIYRPQTGDVDFYLEPEQYSELKQSIIDGKIIKGARIFPRNDLDMVELYNPDIDALGYVSPTTGIEKTRIKLSDKAKQ